jgi:putative transposase
MQLIESSDNELSIKKQCELLLIPRSSYYYKPIPASEDNLKLMRIIDEIYLDFSSYGSRLMTAQLKRMGFVVNRKRVQRLMKLMGIEAIYPKPKKKGVNQEVLKYPYLLKNLPITHPNHVWGADITYIPLNKGFIYLVAVIDLHTRCVLGWELSNNMDSLFCLNSLKQALLKGVPTIMNTDQGTQFTSKDWVGCLNSKGIMISMSGKGRCFDNIIPERFWRTFKFEEVYQKQYENSIEAYESINEYIEKYNKKRLHSSLMYKTPWEV